jgi:hypothetical protein
MSLHNLDCKRIPNLFEVLVSTEIKDAKDTQANCYGNWICCHFAHSIADIATKILNVGQSLQSGLLGYQCVGKRMKVPCLRE